MRTRMITFSIVAAAALALAGVAFAGPELTINGFIDMKVIELEAQPLRVSSPLAAMLQDDGWGWGEDEPKKGGEGEGGGDDGWGWGEEEPPAEKPPEEKPPEEKPAEPPAEEKPPEEKPAEPPAEKPDGKGEGSWGNEGGWKEEPGKGGEEPLPGGEEEFGPAAAGEDQARKLRIGLEFGGFAPLGAKEEGYSAGGIAGVFFGFGLPRFLGDLTVTSEIRLLGGTTSSTGQEAGYDVDTTLIFIKDDYLLHFFPRKRAFNAWWFVGLCLALEMSEATREVSPGVTESTSETFPGFLIDTGFGAWINLGGPIDLLFKLEFNFVPMSKNVSFFTVGEIGIQARF